MTCDGVTGGSGLSPRDAALAFKRNPEKRYTQYTEDGVRRQKNGGRIAQGKKTQKTQSHGAGANGPSIHGNGYNSNKDVKYMGQLIPQTNTAPRYIP